MKIAIGQRAQSGPWGGGNRFLSALVSALRDRGVTIVYDLDDSDIDIILMTDPRVRSPNVCFGPGAILRYLAFRNRDAIVVHRINECDERKGERFINRKLVRANYVADVTVFVGEWLTQLPVWRTHLRQPWHTIRNGADVEVFNRKNFRPWSGQGPLKLVTHHWGYHRMKGFDVYEKIDRMLEMPHWRDRIAFTYVGNLPKSFKFSNVRYLEPLNGQALADELSSHHGYVTASINEPGGNHQNEGALCGLPLLYRSSGCLPEYCDGFGVAFAGPEDFELALERLIAEYHSVAARMNDYPHNAERMTREWISLLETLLADRAGLVARRRLWRKPLTFLANQLEFY